MMYSRSALLTLAILLLFGQASSFSQGNKAKQAARAGRPGEVITRPALAERLAENLKVGDIAPDFTLTTAADRTQQITLSSFRGKQPVVLVFGSISCPPFRRQLEQVDGLYREYKDKAAFFMVYIREAHPDSKILVTPAPGSTEVLQLFPQTDDVVLRSEHARVCTNTFKLQMPLLVDDKENNVNKAYAGWPIRLAVVDSAGKLVYYGGPGPGGFQPNDLKDWLRTNAK